MSKLESVTYALSERAIPSDAAKILPSMGNSAQLAMALSIVSISALESFAAGAILSVLRVLCSMSEQRLSCPEMLWCCESDWWSEG
jgi:hypothetical protein